MKIRIIQNKIIKGRMNECSPQEQFRVIDESGFIVGKVLKQNHVISRVGQAEIEIELNIKGKK